MEKQDVIKFFDRCAPGWDADQEAKDAIIMKILDLAGMKAGQSVLDVACGTGVMFPFYKKLGVASVTGIDISSEMVKVACQKFGGDESIRVICGDVEEAGFGHEFDAVVVYNAFPHFPDPERLIKKLACFLRPGGRLTIAHGSSREAINAHHEAKAHHVSTGLMEADELKALLEPLFTVDVTVSDEQMYQVSGTLR